MKLLFQFLHSGILIRDIIFHKDQRTSIKHVDFQENTMYKKQNHEWNKRILEQVTQKGIEIFFRKKIYELLSVVFPVACIYGYEPDL